MPAARRWIPFLAQFSVSGRAAFNVRFSGKGNGGIAWAATEAGYGESLALREAARALVAAIQPVVLGATAAPPPPPPPLPPPAAVAPAPPES